MAKTDLITREIPVSSKAYLICTDLEGESLETVLDALASEAFRQGALEAYFSWKDPSRILPVEGFSTRRYGLDFHTDILRLEKELTDASESLPLIKIPLSKTNRDSYRDLTNRSFLGTVNASTVTYDDLELMIHDEKCEAGLLVYEGRTVGTYELSFASDLPELNSLAIDVRIQGQGLGRRALATLEADLRQRAYPKIRLTVATANPRAYALYLSNGYRRVGLVSRWFWVRDLNPAERDKTQSVPELT